MAEYVGLLISTARRRIKQAVLSRARSHRLPPQQFWTLVAIREHPSLSQRELADQLRIDAPTTSRVLASLVERRLVVLEGDPSDRRRLRPRLAPAGDAAARELAEIAREVRAAVTRGMDADEVAALRTSLRKVIANMERLETDGDLQRARPAAGAKPAASNPKRRRRAPTVRGGAVDGLADGESA